MSETSDDRMPEECAIRDVAEATGVSVHTLRYYEDAGLMIGVPRRSNGHRVYSGEHIKWVRFLKRLRAAGMSIARVREYVRLAKEGESSLPERVRLLEEHRHEVAAKLEELSSHLEVIDRKIRLYRDQGQGCETAIGSSPPTQAMGDETDARSTRRPRPPVSR